MPYDKDLVVVAPDKNTEFFLHGLFSKAEALGMAAVPTYQVEMHLLRDSGCLDANEFLKSQINRFAHALVVVANREQSGELNESREAMEADLEIRLARSGWDNRAMAIVADPGISRWLLEHQLGTPWSKGGQSPRRMVENILRARRLPQSPERYRKLGVQIVEEGDADPALRKIFGALWKWFVPTPINSRTMTRAAKNAQFSALTEEWLEQTRLTSSVANIVANNAYRAIIDMGQDIVPFILRDMEREPKHWGPALRELTGANPVRKESVGRVRLMAQDWINWAKEHGYVW